MPRQGQSRTRSGGRGRGRGRGRRRGRPATDMETAPPGTPAQPTAPGTPAQNTEAEPVLPELVRLGQLADRLTDSVVTQLDFPGQVHRLVHAELSSLVTKDTRVTDPPQVSSLGGHSLSTRQQESTSWNSDDFGDTFGDSDPPARVLGLRSRGVARSTGMSQGSSTAAPSTWTPQNQDGGLRPTEHVLGLCSDQDGRRSDASATNPPGHSEDNTPAAPTGHLHTGGHVLGLCPPGSRQTTDSTGNSTTEPGDIGPMLHQLRCASEQQPQTIGSNQVLSGIPVRDHTNHSFACGRGELAPTSAQLPLDYAVPLPVKKKIWANEYIEFTSLLNPSQEGLSRFSVLTDDNDAEAGSLCLVPTQKKAPKTIKDWSTAFNIYTTVFTQK